MLSHGAVVIVMTMMSMNVIAQGARPQEVELQRAIRAETIDGDVQAALRLYGDLAARYATSDRAIAAQALVRQGLIYQRLNHPRARAVLERVVNEFGDQRQPAAQARQALGGNSRRVTQARVSAVVDGKGPNAVSPDGRWIVFASRDGFVIRRNGSAEDHISVAKADTPVFSPDSKRVAFNDWGRQQLSVASLEGRWNPRPVTPTPKGVRYYDPGGWSRDGQSLLVEIVHGETNRDQDWTKEIAWLSLATGDTRVLLDLGRRRPQDQGERLRLSPDGQWIVYSALAVDPGANAPRQAQERDRHLYVLSAQGGTPSELVEGNINVRPVWTPDSRRVVFVSNRSGSFGLWSISVTARRESPVVEMPSSGRIVPMAITRDGSLYFARRDEGHDLLVAEARVDGRVGTPVRLATGESGGNFAPAFSPDRRFIAYLRQRKDRPAATYALVVHSTQDHTERVFNSHELAYGDPVWLADGRRVLVTEKRNVPPVRGTGSLPQGRLILDVVTGEMTPATDSDRPRTPVRIALPAGTSGEERTSALSPDGARITFIIAERGTNTGSLWLADADGRGARQLAAAANTRMLVWAADSTAIYFLEPRGDGARLMRVPAAGGAPLYTGLTLPLDRQRGATIGGSQLVFAQESSVSELWVVRNFAMK